MHTPAERCAVHTRFILLRPSHAGNVGAVARAIKVMGFGDMVLLQPRWDDVLSRPEALERASGADDVLRAARVVQSWQEATEGVQYLCASAMTPRDFGPPTHTPREHLAQLAAQTRRAQAPVRSVGIVLGCERFGMSNEDVYRCHVCLHIPTNAAYGSLNLAAAAQVLAYEWRLALGGFAPCNPMPAAPRQTLADAAQIHGLLQHWREALQASGFLNARAPKKLMPRLQQLLHRAQLRQDEVHILRGIARTLQARSGKAPSPNTANTP